MGEFKVTKTDIEGVVVLEPKVFGDERGFFFENYNKRDLKACGIDVEFVQDNQAQSTKGVLRGLHFQKKHPQGKLVSVILGSVYDVAVDLRNGSKTYGKYFATVLSGENKKSVYVPEGFAHGYLVLSESARFSYKCTDYYHPEDEGGIRYDDPDVGVDWPELSGTKLLINSRDLGFPYLKDLS
ncbi:MAG: dTDP-4-dehydrorhamnose 3,5-epimerase [Lachnospiraceae bacterium]|nr:dTDP-4-dehydrorhamnose 3,5-epimerase [Lachnospiraceae bacterium]